MEKKAIDHLEEIYKNEINSHDIKKAINNVDIISFKIKNFNINKKLSSKNSKFIQDTIPFKNTLIFRNNINKDSTNINSFKPKESIENLFVYSNSEHSKKEEEEKINDIKINKRNNLRLKVCKTFKNCEENIKNAKFLFFNKGNNKQSMKPLKNFSNKNCLTNNKRGSNFQISKRHKKQKDKEKDSFHEKDNDVILKKKKTFHRTSNSNNKLLYFQTNNIIKDFEKDNYENGEEKNKGNNKNNCKDNKDNKEKLDNVIYQFQRKRTKSNYIKRYINSNSNSNKNKKKVMDKTKHDNDTDKNKKNNNIKTMKNNQEIVYDTDNEVENNILRLLDKSFKKRNSVLNNNKKKKHYGTQEIFNDKFLRNFHNSIVCKNNKTNDFGKISNFSNISIIKKTELNHYDINNNDDSDDFFHEFTKKSGPKFKGMSAQKVVSFEYKDNDNDENKNEDFMNYNTKNKRKKKFIIYNNINYFKTTQRDDNELIDKNKDNNINNEKKNNIIISNKKNSFSNNFANRCCSLFNCCFLLD